MILQPERQIEISNGVTIDAIIDSDSDENNIRLIIKGNFYLLKKEDLIDESSNKKIEIIKNGKTIKGSVDTKTDSESITLYIGKKLYIIDKEDLIGYSNL